MVSFTKVNKNNVTFQPRENIIALLKDELSISGVRFYSILPDFTGRNFSGFPIVLIPEQGLSQLGDVTLKGNIQYGNELVCSIYHDHERLGDDKLRTIKQDFIRAISERANSKKLGTSGVSGLNLEFEDGSPIPELIDNKKIVNAEFSISFQIDVDMGA